MEAYFFCFVCLFCFLFLEKLRETAWKLVAREVGMIREEVGEKHDQNVLIEVLNKKE